jgi:site-specific DNA-cytosine methylase
MNQPQQCEIRKDDVSNTVTTVPKDFLVAILDDTYKGRNVRQYTEYAPTIRANRKGFKVVIRDNDVYRLLRDEKDLKDDTECVFIREMSNLETFRLMGYSDEDYEKVKKAVNEKFYKGKDKSQTRLYKMAGNSIVVGVCEEIFKELLIKNNYIHID